MCIGRAILVALIALSVAMLPVAGNVARAMSPEAAFNTVHADCCPHGKPCDKRTTNDCGSMAGCALKCFSFFGAMVSGVNVGHGAAADLAPVLASLGFRSNPMAPPLPPPRV